MLSIGEFSKITGLSIKTLRFYHDNGLLVPARVEQGTGYRYYDRNNVEKARVIVRLRSLDFALKEIAEILEQYDDESEILTYLEQKKQVIRDRIQQFGDIVGQLERIISLETQARLTMQNSNYEVEEKQVDSMLIAGVRMTGKYSDCGQGFAKIGRKFGRFICGKPLLLHYNDEYREDDADFEACMPIRKEKDVPGVSVRQLPAGRCISLLHKGPYEEMGRSYEKILAYVKEKGFEIVLPTREVYIKGPGMIFKGNPKKYLTEILLPVKA